MLMRQQDSTLGVISGTLSTLASQAGLIGQEVNEHNVCAAQNYRADVQNDRGLVVACGQHPVSVDQSHANVERLHPKERR